MALLRTNAPATTPVSLSEAKAHCRIDGEDEDALLTALIEAATAHVERHLGLALITQGWTIIRDVWPETWFAELPLAPLQAADSVTVYDAAGDGAVFDAAHYFLDAASLPPRLILHGTASWPSPGQRANGIEIAVTAGYGDGPDDIPGPIRQALLQLVACWYEAREPVIPGETSQIPLPGAVAGLLSPYRAVRL